MKKNMLSSADEELDKCVYNVDAEQFHCKVKKNQYDDESEEELTIDNLEQAFAETDKSFGLYSFDGDTYLWYDGQLYEESPHDMCGARDGTFYTSEYDSNCWRPIKKKKKKQKKKSSSKCHRCGRNGHYKSSCYANRHIKGFCLG